MAQEKEGNGVEGNINEGGNLSNANITAKEEEVIVEDKIEKISYIRKIMELLLIFAILAVLCLVITWYLNFIDVITLSTEKEHQLEKILAVAIGSVATKFATDVEKYV